MTTTRPRPCHCDRARADTPRAKTDCVPCWMWKNRPDLFGRKPGDPEPPPPPGVTVGRLAPQGPSPPPPRVSLPCVHEGPVREYCKTCGPKEGRHVRTCYHDDNPTETCTRLPVSAAVRACSTCPDYRPADPGPTLLPPARVVEIGPAGLAKGRAGWAFNAGLIRFKGRLLMPYRTDWAGSRVHVAELTEDYGVISTTQLDLPHPRATGGQEDPRLFDAGGELRLHFVGVEAVRGRGRTSQLYARLTDDLRVAAVHCPEPTNFARQEPKEKNWSPFWHDGEHLAVYETGPRHVVVRIDGDRAERVADTPVALPWSGGFLRGGAPPVRVGDRYYHWFHGRVGTDRHPWYNVGLAVFEARPPFRVVAMSPHPMLWGDMAANLTTDRSYACTAFPCGAVIENGVWKVSMGWNDRGVRIGEWSHDSVNAAIGLGPPA